MPISKKKQECVLVKLDHNGPRMEPFYIDNPRWPQGAVIKNSTNTKMTIAQEPLDDIDPTLCQNVSYMELF